MQGLHDPSGNEILVGRAGERTASGLGALDADQLGSLREKGVGVGHGELRVGLDAEHRRSGAQHGDIAVIRAREHPCAWGQPHHLVLMHELELASSR